MASFEMLHFSMNKVVLKFLGVLKSCCCQKHVAIKILLLAPEWGARGSSCSCCQPVSVPRAGLDGMTVCQGLLGCLLPHACKADSQTFRKVGLAECGLHRRHFPPRLFRIPRPLLLSFVVLSKRDLILCCSPFSFRVLSPDQTLSFFQNPCSAEVGTELVVVRIDYLYSAISVHTQRTQPRTGLWSEELTNYSTLIFVAVLMNQMQALRPEFSRVLVLQFDKLRNSW